MIRKKGIIPAHIKPKQFHHPKPDHPFVMILQEVDVQRFASAVRDHWGVENALHWFLDVIFNEDSHRYQDRIGAANLSLVRKVALSMLTQDKTLTCGRPAKQMRAATSSEYRDHLIKNCF